MSTKVVVCFSGGIESTIVATMLAHSGAEVHLVYTRQGDTASYQLDSLLASLVASEIGAKFVELEMGQVYGQLKTPGQFYVPGYMMLAYLGALSYADKIKSYAVYTGEQLAAFNPNDYDNDDELRGFMNLCGRNTEESSHVQRARLAEHYGRFYYPYDADSGSQRYAFAFIDPLYGINKAEGIRLGSILSAPLWATRTCKNEEVARVFCNYVLKLKQEGRSSGAAMDVALGNTPTHCGQATCHFCMERKRAFQEAGMEDPTKYRATE